MAVFYACTWNDGREQTPVRTTAKRNERGVIYTSKRSWEEQKTSCVHNTICRNAATNDEHQTKELAIRYERALQDSESTTEKWKNRLETTSEELERVLLQKEGESFKDTGVQSRSGGSGGKRVIGKAVAKGGLLLKGRNPGNVGHTATHRWERKPDIWQIFHKIQRQEDDIRARVSTASDQYRKAVFDTQAMRQEYFNFQLPRILRVSFDRVCVIVLSFMMIYRR